MAACASTDLRRRSRLSWRCSSSSRRVERLEPLVGFLGGAGRAGEDVLGSDVDVGELDATRRDQEFADLIGVRHAARFEDVERPVALAVAFDGLDEQPGVDERGDLLVRAIAFPAAVESDEQGRDAVALQVVDLTGQHGRHLGVPAFTHEVGDRVQHHELWLEVRDQLLQLEEVGLQAQQARAHAVKLQQPGVDPAFRDRARPRPCCG